jgi:hypothetical protein
MGKRLCKIVYQHNNNRFRITSWWHTWKSTQVLCGYNSNPCRHKLRSHKKSNEFGFEHKQCYIGGGCW